MELEKNKINELYVLCPYTQTTTTAARDARILYLLWSILTSILGAQHSIMHLKSSF